MIHRLVETTPPAAEPLTLAEMKVYLRVDHDNDDPLITDLIAAARELCESVTGRSLITRGYSLYLDEWPSCRALELPQLPLISVDQVNVYGADNSSDIFDAVNYTVDTAGLPGRLVLTEGALPPLPGRVANGIEIQFTAGYGGDAADVPVLLRQGMKQAVAYMYENRGDSRAAALNDSGAAGIFQPYRLASLK